MCAAHPFFLKTVTCGLNPPGSQQWAETIYSLPSINIFIRWKERQTFGGKLTDSVVQ